MLQNSLIFDFYAILGSLRPLWRFSPLCIHLVEIIFDPLRHFHSSLKSSTLASSEIQRSLANHNIKQFQTITISNNIHSFQQFFKLCNKLLAIAKGLTSLWSLQQISLMISMVQLLLLIARLNYFVHFTLVLGFNFSKSF